VIQWQTINIVDISAQLSVLNLHLSYPFFVIFILRPYHQLIFLYCSLLNSHFDGSGSYMYACIYICEDVPNPFCKYSMPMNLIPFFYPIVLLTSTSLSFSMSIYPIFASVENPNSITNLKSKCV
jgi:hypothetical protein